MVETDGEARLMSSTTRKALWSVLVLVLCAFAFLRLRTANSQAGRTWVDRNYHVFFRLDDGTKAVEILDVATGRPEGDQALRAIAIRESKAVTSQLADQTRMKRAEGEFYLSLQGYSQPFLIKWFDPKIPALAQFMTAAEFQDIETVRESLAKGINVNARDFGTGRTALIWAAGDAARGVSPSILKRLTRPPDKRVLEVLLAAGADPNVKDINGLTALMRADSSQVRVLVRYGADLNARDHEGRTPLVYAVDFGTLDRCRALIDAGAALGVPDNDGWTALMYAANEGDLAKAELLLRAGADPNSVGKSGETALSIVSKKREQTDADKRIMQLLTESRELRR